MNRIFNFLVISVMIGVFGQEEPLRKYTEELQQHTQRCATENKISNNIKLQFMNNSPDGLIQKSRRFSCFLGCVYQAMEFVSPDGQLLMNNIFEKLNNVYTMEWVDYIFDWCGRIAEKDLCERSYSLYSCFDHLTADTRYPD
ncbi:uncharacterized protein LOC129740689 [Uranotaenia lowii]|uniref:uncharacterized protein LOC129740689 n=1 Tax=Uranotaenia lowii TaxID=190385 RepID=UPI002479A9B9|nr:uncharacterized protein LOC129740689 [Uranotaenia lowii]